MPFQATPIAFGKNTGSPTSKLLLIWLYSRSEVSPEWTGQSALYNFIPEDAARFCQCTVPEVMAALEDLRKLRLVWPDEQWTEQLTEAARQDPYDEWEFLRVAMPTSATPASERGRFRYGSDQLNLFWHRDGYRCVSCGKHGDEVDRWAVDHIIPRSVGGADVEENCQAICSTCNGRKGSRVHWVDFLGGRR